MTQEEFEQELARKQCAVCNEIKSFDDFYRHTSGNPKRECKACTIAHGRAYREAHQAERIAYDKEYAQKNKERLTRQSIARAKANRKANPLKTRQYDHELNRRRLGSIPMQGYLYLIDGGQGCFKIGRSIDPHARLKKMKTAIPHAAQIVWIVPSSDMAAHENKLQNRFLDKRLQGEWFALTPVDVEQIKAIKSGDELNE